MRVIIAGSRSIQFYAAVEDAVQASPWAQQIDVVISGGAGGVDRLGEQWAKRHAKLVVQRLPDWSHGGARAALVRNEAMAEEGDALIAVWNGESRGTAHMIRCMETRGKPVFVYRFGSV